MRSLFTFLIALLALAFALPTAAQSETDVKNVSDVTISATIRTYVLSAPRANAEFVRSFEAGAADSAYGRDEAGNWLRTLDGWVLAEVFRGQGEIAELPDATASINVTVAAAAQLYDGPSARWFDAIGELAADAEALAIGRNEGGSWLRLSQGWIEVAQVNTAGDIRPLPVMASPGVVITAKSRTFILAEPDLGAEFVDVFEAGDEALATGRAGDWLQIARGWVSAEAVEVSGDTASLAYTGEGIRIVSKRSRHSMSVWTVPGSRALRVRRVKPGVEEIAIGRAENGRYLFLGDGWVLVAEAEAQGNILLLPVVTEESTILSNVQVGSAENELRLTLKTARVLYDEPSAYASQVGSLQWGAVVIAEGRNAQGSWLRTEKGWFFVGDTTSAKASVLITEGDIMTLPVFDETTASRSTSASSSNTTRSRATATPRPQSGLDARTIRSLVSRHTDDIRILDIEIISSATTIEYDLKPWPFVPNEQIANEVAFKIICALRNGQEIPNRLELIGQSHFKSDVGRKFTSPSVEIHISARNANRIVCRGNTYSDISWRSLASLYKSYPIPRGASVDYD